MICVEFVGRSPWKVVINLENSAGESHFQCVVYALVDIKFAVSTTISSIHLIGCGERIFGALKSERTDHDWIISGIR